MLESKDSVVFSIRLLSEDLELWKRFCEEELSGANPSTVIREFILSVNGSKKTKNNSQYSYRALPPEAEYFEKKNQRMNCYFTKSEIEGIKNKAKESEMSRANWVALAVRSALRIDAEPLPKSHALIVESNLNLAKIGSNLNQIARKLNQHHPDLNAESLQISLLADKIDKHTSTVKKYLSSCTRRWKLEKL